MTSPIMTSSPLARRRYRAVVTVDPNSALHDLVRHLVADGDRRARQAGRRAPRTRAEMHSRMSGLLAEVAEHLATHRPDEPMTEAARMTTALGLARTAKVAAPLLQLMPFPTGRTTRGQYADQLRRLATPSKGR